MRHREWSAEQEQALDDVICRNADELCQLGNCGTLRYVDAVKLGEVLVVLDSLFDLLLVFCLCLLLLATLLAPLAPSRGLFGGLAHRLARLFQDVLAVVLLSLMRHATVAIVALLPLMAGALVASATTGPHILLFNRGLFMRRRGSTTTTASAHAASFLCRTPASRFLFFLSGLLGLLLEHLLLLCNLIEQI